MKTLLAGLCAALIASSSWADYQRGFYGSVGLAKVSGDDRTGFEDAELSMVELIGGYKYNAALGLELRAGYGSNEDKDNSSTYFADIAAADDTDTVTAIERELSNYAAIYYRPELISDEARLYGLLGYARLDTEVTLLGDVATDQRLASQSESHSGLSYGMGIGFFIQKRFGINFEYRRLLSKDDYRFKTAGINFDYRF